MSSEKRSLAARLRKLTCKLFGHKPKRLLNIYSPDGHDCKPEQWRNPVIKLEMQSFRCTRCPMFWTDIVHSNGKRETILEVDGDAQTAEHYPYGKQKAVTEINSKWFRNHPFRPGYKKTT